MVSCLAPALVFLYAGYERRWAGDDGFINTRVVEQLIDGNGFVFNAGERTEAVTSAGWVLVLWLLGELGCNVDTAGCVTSLALSFIGLLCAALAAARITAGEDEDTLVLPLGVLAYAGIPVAWDYETSLLENGLGLAFLGVSFLLMARVTGVRSDERPPRAALVALFIGLSPLVRPDFVLYAAPLGLILFLTAQGRRERTLVAVCGALPGGAFQLFRMGYFACLVPNTAIAKEAFDARWDQGLFYFENTANVYWLGVPLAIAMVALALVVTSLVRRGLRMRAAVPLALALSGVLHILYVVRLGGDFMHGRMLLPALFAIFAAIGVVRVSWFARVWVGGAAVACAAMLAWAVCCAEWLRPELFVHGILDERRWWSETSGQPNPTNLHHYENHTFYKIPLGVKARFAEGCPGGLASLGDDMGDFCKRVAWPDTMDGRLSDFVDNSLLPLNPSSAPSHIVGVYAFRPLGISGRLMGLRVNLTDSFGLADPLASRMELAQRGRPGHEKVFDVVWWAAKYITPNGTNDGRVAIARHALRCGLLRELHEATRQELTVSRFFKNIVSSFALHRVRVPVDPQVAVDRFCHGAS